MTERQRRYNQSEKGKAAARRAREKYRAKNPDYWLRSKFGLSGEQWAELAKNGCGICGTMEDLVVDHDHKTGRVRGALCRKHNAAIGLLSDDPDLLRRATAWLEREV
jgi:hypothetical protein